MANTTKRLLRLKEVQNQIGLGRTSIYQKIKDGQFPRQVSIGTKAVAWVSSDINAWIESRIKDSKGDIS